MSEASPPSEPPKKGQTGRFVAFSLGEFVFGRWLVDNGDAPADQLAWGALATGLSVVVTGGWDQVTRRIKVHYMKGLVKALRAKHLYAEAERLVNAIEYARLVRGREDLIDAAITRAFNALVDADLPPMLPPAPPQPTPPPRTPPTTPPPLTPPTP